MASASARTCSASEPPKASTACTNCAFTTSRNCWSIRSAMSWCPTPCRFETKLISAVCREAATIQDGRACSFPSFWGGRQPGASGATSASGCLVSLERIEANSPICKGVLDGNLISRIWARFVRNLLKLKCQYHWYFDCPFLPLRPRRLALITIEKRVRAPLYCKGPISNFHPKTGKVCPGCEINRK
jgi:hypothetical protein